ncbi:glucose 1-dehydrogenase [Vibrio sp. SCSIO 43140]|uniref:glucose 1-dehydrogenase n=1 Tax=Vibrio sp. SCSIO 43140 TaxID=2819100 RepID=UPI002075763F|nr:glucose 1-dehydrogenase [Vibrio sp. SCSIO 43140]USD61850.1 glucose 1-dehydrogenase [Vibrio sp. SCSIO 43140]
MGRLIVVTGGSRGIGSETAKLLAEQGHRVIVNYLANKTRAEETVESIRKEGGQAWCYQADIANEDEVVAMFSQVYEKHGEIDGLVNNAGILSKQCTLEALTSERINKILMTNVTGALICCREAVKYMSSDSGSIVNVSSRAAVTGSPFEYVDYAASKGALDTITKGLSLELASRNIRVNGVRPGLIHTEMHADGGEPERVNRLAAQIPLGRGGEAEEVAQAIVWLLSDDASFVTGTFIDVSGGK